MFVPADGRSKSAASSWICVRRALFAWNPSNLSRCAFALALASSSDPAGVAGAEERGEDRADDACARKSRPVNARA